jgi:glyoxalase superfamily protein
MIGSLQCVVLDCPDPLKLAQFYRSLLGGTVNLPDPRWALSRSWATLHTGSGMVLAFQRAADYRPPRWPDPAQPQQFHLDIEVADLNQAHALVIEFGATLLDDGGGVRGWRVYADPAGHPFCLIGH